MTTAVFATAYGGPEVLRPRTSRSPHPARAQVTIEVRAAGINPDRPTRSSAA